jgi:nidogen (entactin)
VNTNGLLSFITDVPTFINIEFPIGYPVIAPFYANADTSKAGTVYYRETQDAYMLVKAEEDLKLCFPQHYHFQPTDLFIATWSDVGYHKAGSDKMNTFQAIVASNGNESYAIFLYPENGIEWIQAKSEPSGLSDARAQIGLTAEEGKAFVLKSSGKEIIRMVASYVFIARRACIVLISKFSDRRTATLQGNICSESVTSGTPSKNRNQPR